MRLVSLTPSNTEILHALGLGSALVGVDDHSDYPPEVVGDLPRVGPDLQIDVNKVARLRPDLVLASLSVPGMERIVKQLQDHDLPQIVLNPLSLDDVIQDILRVGEAVGVPDRARDLAMEMQQRLAEVDRKTRSRRAGHPSLRVFWEWWPKPLITPGRRSWINDLLRLAAARNLFEHLDAPSRPVEPEAVLEADPDCIVLCWCGTLQRVMDPASLEQRRGWERLRAVRANRVLALPEELFGRPGPRLVEGAEVLAGVLHH